MDTTSTTKPCKKCGGTRRYKPRPGRKTGACIDCANKLNREWARKDRKNNPEIYKQRLKKYKDNHPERGTAHWKVNNAIKYGKLPKISDCSCADCGIEAREYHHKDYSKPLEVVPLCHQCHIKRHLK